LNCTDVILFQAEMAPEKPALIAPGSGIPYGRIAQGILSVQQRLTAAGITEGQTVGIHIVHPIEHMVLACALYRMGIASATIINAPEVNLDLVPFDAVLSDRTLPTVSVKQPAARFVIIDPSWFQDQIPVTMAHRASGSRHSAPDWVSRITCYPDNLPTVVRTTSRSLEAQLLTYNLSAPASWERMICLAGSHTNTGFLQVLSALWLGRSVCFADLQSVRNLISIYKHDYLVAPAEEFARLLTLQKTHFTTLHALRSASFEGRVCDASTVARGLSTISSNLLFRYIHPDIGIVAYGDTSRFRAIDGAVGFVAPWIEAQVIDADGVPLPAEKEGTLRFRPREFDLAAPVQASQQAMDGWIYPQQPGRLMSDNLLVIGRANR
jgi:hypothetical protein